MERYGDLEQRLTSGMPQLAPEPSWGFVDRVNGLVDATTQRTGALPRWRMGLPDLAPRHGAIAVLLLLAALASMAAAVVVLSRPPTHPVPSPTSVALRAVALPGPISGQPAFVNSVVMAGGQFVAVGSALGGDIWGGPADIGMIWTSRDGLGWTTVAAIDGANITGVARDANTLVAVGSRAEGTEAAFATTGEVWMSTDGQTWETIDVGADPFSSIVYGFGVFAAARCPMGDGVLPPACAIWTSPDGRSWTSQADATGGGRLRATARAIILVGGGDTRGGQGYSVLSRDGVTWERSRSQANLVNMTPWDVTSAGGFVALGAYESVAPQITPGVWILTGDGLDWQLGAYVASFYDPYPGLLVQGTTDVITVTDEGGTPNLVRWAAGAFTHLTAEGGNGPEQASYSDAIALDGGRFLLVGEQTAVPTAPLRPYAWISEP